MGVSVKIQSNLPIGGGLGSSASYSAALVSGLLYYYKHIQSDPKNMSSDDCALINDWAFISETIIHGNPSGIDNSICVFGGAKMYTQGVLEDVDEYEFVCSTRTVFRL